MKTLVLMLWFYVGLAATIVVGLAATIVVGLEVAR